jgi:hypothetical protein
VSRLTTRKMSDRHETDVAELLGMRRTRGSGNQFADQMDGKHDEGRWRFAFDGKATLGKSVGVSREMWAKAVEQSHGARPLLPLRFYDDERLAVGLDLVVCDLHDLAEMVEVLRGE